MFTSSTDKTFKCNLSLFITTGILCVDSYLTQATFSRDCKNRSVLWKVQPGTCSVLHLRCLLYNFIFFQVSPHCHHIRPIYLFKPDFCFSENAKCINIWEEHHFYKTLLQCCQCIKICISHGNQWK